MRLKKLAYFVIKRRIAMFQADIHSLRVDFVALPDWQIMGYAVAIEIIQPDQIKDIEGLCISIHRIFDFIWLTFDIDLNTDISRARCIRQLRTYQAKVVTYLCFDNEMLIPFEKTRISLLHDFRHFLLSFGT